MCHTVFLKRVDMYSSLYISVPNLKLEPESRHHAFYDKMSIFLCWYYCELSLDSQRIQLWTEKS